MSTYNLPLETSKIIATVQEGIGWITINNPERRNAISMDMRKAIAHAAKEFEANQDVRVVVLRGAGGKSFAAGADISEFDQHRANAEQARRSGAIAVGSLGLLDLTKPLVAMIEGFCIGGGLLLALAADVRFATTGSVFGIPAAKLGLGYPYEGVATLARVVGTSVARDMIFSARILAADEALRVGLINLVEDAEDIEAKVREYAARVACNAPLTIHAAKAAVRAYEQATAATDTSEVAVLVDRCFDSEDYKEGRQAFMEKRTPRSNAR